MLTRRSFAKINLTLEVLGRRPDGYHEIRSVLQTIGLHDTLTFRPFPGLSLRCGVPSLAAADNLVLEAAQALQRAAGTRQGAAIELAKRIPVAAGLGGGSGDAAAALLALNRLWQLNWPLEKLAQIAARVGSDVPFFLYGGTALVRGRGEQVEPLPPSPARWVVLLRPPIDIPNKTRALYAALGDEDYSDGSRAEGLAAALREGKDFGDGDLCNAFEGPAGRLFPPILAARQQLLRAGAPPPHLAGSGPTWFVLYRSPEEARALRRRLARAGLAATLTRTLAAGAALAPGGVRAIMQP